MPGGNSNSNGGWSRWSKWVRSALETVLSDVGDLTLEVKGIREDVAPRLATLEERCSAERMENLTTGIQDNKVSLAKMGGAGLLGGGAALALLKLVEAVVVSAGGVP